MPGRLCTRRKGPHGENQHGKSQADPQRVNPHKAPGHKSQTTQRRRERLRQPQYHAVGRHERTLAPQGERRTLFAQDIVGTSEQILERLFADPILPHVRELRLELPYEFEDEEYRQIVGDFVARIAPELGWQPQGEIETNAPPARAQTGTA